MNTNWTYVKDALPKNTDVVWIACNDGVKWLTKAYYSNVTREWYLEENDKYPQCFSNRIYAWAPYVEPELPEYKEN